MFVTLNFGPVEGLSAEELQQLQDLADAYNYHQSRNRLKDKYYEGHVTLQDVTLALPCRRACATWKWAAAGARRPWMFWRPAPCSTAL